jgi:gliding motility-associated-like protein
MRTTYITLLLCWLTATVAFAQRQTDNWHFGSSGNLEFGANGLPVSTLSSAMATASEGCASISDKNGQLLFYTNGETVYDRSNNVMLNGNNLLGHINSTQSSLIVPKPGSDSLFYLFTTDAIQNSLANGISYSVIDMDANFPLGAVIASQKNMPLYAPAGVMVSEKLTGVHHFNNQEVWVIGQSFISPLQQEFMAFKVTANGISAPVISTLPAGPGGNAMLNCTGYLKASPDGSHLAANYGSGGSYLFDFDNKTGQVSNPVQLRYSPSSTYYGLEFSQDGSKLYTCGGFVIEQFNLSAGTAAAIVASRTQLNIGSQYGAMQLARNGRIYVARPGLSSLMEIAAPNLAGQACNLRQGPGLVLPSSCLNGLPNFIQSYFTLPRFEFTGQCAESPVSFTIPNQSGIDSVKWSFGDPGSGSLNASKQLQPSHTFMLPVTFPVQLTIYSQGFSSVFERQVFIRNKPATVLADDIETCQGNTVVLKNLYPRSQFNESFLWSTGDTGFAINVTTSGFYWLELSNGACTTRDSILVTFLPRPKVNLGASQFICGIRPVILDAGNPGCTYSWSPGKETSQTITVTKPGTYSVIVTAPNGCTATDRVSISMINVPELELGEDIVICEGEPVTLKGPDPNGSNTYLWSDGSSFPVLNPTKSGKYWVRVKQDICTISDTINIIFKPCPPPPVPVIPNIITPNGDNINDKLVLKEIPEGVWHLKIYNRWGQLLLNQAGYQNNWPATELKDGTYYYLLEDPETKRLFKGWVEVVH